MQKLESSLKNMVLVLVGVALVVGAVLAYVNHITSGPIAQKAEQSLAAGIKSVMGTDDLQVAAPEEVPQTIDGKKVTFIVHACTDKSGNAVDAITASTITSRAFLKAINQAYAAYTKQGTDGKSGATKVKKG